jgi:hypothetical protein
MIRTAITLFTIGTLILVSRHTTAQDSYANSSSETIHSTVQVSVCGNSIVEGGEVCDTTNLGAHTCESLGYTSGTLHCASSCELDTRTCIPFQERTPLIGRDPNHSGRISPQELPDVLAEWIQDWYTNTECDINNDATCNITDLSIILYYVE